MKVAVTAQGAALKCRVDPTFGRATYLIEVDPDTDDFLSHDNTKNRNALQGAGIQAARDTIEMGVEAVITGNIGHLAFDTLKAGDVKVYVGAKGSVADAIGEFKDGRLLCAIEPTVDERWM